MRRPLLRILPVILGLAACASGGEVKSEPQVSVKAVRFAGEMVLPPGRLRRAMGLRDDNPQAIQHGVARARSLLLRAGYLEADVHAEIEGDLATVFVEAGRK